MRNYLRITSMVTIKIKAGKTNLKAQVWVKNREKGVFICFGQPPGSFSETQLPYDLGTLCVRNETCPYITAAALFTTVKRMDDGRKLNGPSTCSAHRMLSLDPWHKPKMVPLSSAEGKEVTLEHHEVWLQN